ncbi:glycosyltransferase family 4 protein [Microseira wollei]|uniref:Glycosyl transferase group 1 n=1 Tax=Microseira wollei NIES-4236 TaxID=2530354 RepID=A0AAV3X988_9CYAN|nr:glycosyltransferase family 4 protein [Microseira wollei]GET37933.1 glycosyl transferase group 1 [Microseira wollei NIES-4236]
MRILIYSYNYAPEPIGIAPLMTELAEGLAKRGHRVRVVTGMPNYPERRIYTGYRGKLWITERSGNGVVVQRNWLWVRPKPNLLDRILLDGSFVLLSLVHAIKGKRPDVILLTSPPLPVSVPAALLGWLHRCRVVLNLQDILPEAAIHTGLLTNKTMIRVFEALEKFAYRTAHKISAISDVFVENLVKKGVREDKIALIPNWVDVNFIRPLPKENNAFRIAHQLEGKFVVLYSGNIARTQGLNTVIEAAVRLQHIPDIVFAIVGEGNALHELQQYCQDRGADNVRLLPFVPREKLPEMLAAADVGLIVQKSNVIAFNMPSKTQVLLASGRPIVASVPASGTAARAVKQSGGGLVVAPEDPDALAFAVKDLYADREKAEKFGQQGRRYAVEQYSFEQALDRYEALFAEVTTAPATIRNAVPN